MRRRTVFRILRWAAKAAGGAAGAKAVVTLMELLRHLIFN